MKDLRWEILSAIEERWDMYSRQLDSLDRSSPQMRERLLKVTSAMAELENVRNYIESLESI